MGPRGPATEAYFAALTAARGKRDASRIPRQRALNTGTARELTAGEAELKEAREELSRLDDLYAQLPDRLNAASRRVDACELAVDRAKENATAAHTVASA